MSRRFLLKRTTNNVKQRRLSHKKFDKVDVYDQSVMDHSHICAFLRLETSGGQKKATVLSKRKMLVTYTIKIFSGFVKHTRTGTGMPWSLTDRHTVLFFMSMHSTGTASDGSSNMPFFAIPVSYSVIMVIPSYRTRSKILLYVPVRTYR